jgi:Tfp pilus assembly protein PilF
LAALRRLHTLLAKDPDSAEAYNLMGFCEVSLGGYVAAQTAFEKSIHLDSYLVAARVNFGHLMLRMHKESAALKQFEAALAINPGILTRDAQ